MMLMTMGDQTTMRILIRRGACDALMRGMTEEPSVKEEEDWRLSGWILALLPLPTQITPSE